MLKETEPEKGSGWRQVLGAVASSEVDFWKDAGRFFLIGAVVGAVVAGGAGFHYFGMLGLGIGALAGAVIGGIGLMLMYIMA